MRIGIDYTSALNQRAGIGRFTRGMVRGLAQVDRENQYLLVHARSRAGRENVWPDNFACRQLPLGERALAALWHRLGVPAPVELFLGQVDVFHAPDYLLPPLRRAMGVITVHDLSFILYPEHAEPSLVRYLSRNTPKSVERARIVLADSKSTKNDLVRLLGVAESKVEVVYGGVDEHFTKVMDPSTIQRVRRNYPLDRPYLFSLGTIEPRKNLTGLMEAYANLRRTGRITHRLLIGGAKGWRNSGLARVYERLSLKEDIVFLGFIPDADLPALYSLADLFVYPSLYEGFGLPPLEAMACGTPVVSSNSSSLPEVVGEAGSLVDPLDTASLAAAIEDVLRDREKASLMSRLGREQAARFTWEKTAHRLISIYRQMGGN